jgi:hypothetical protein
MNAAAQGRFLIPLLAGMLVAGSSHACSRAFATDLDFAEGSAVLGKAEVVKLVVWLDKWRAIFPRFEGVLVDGIAPATVEDAKTLARLRAEVTAQAVRQLLGGVPISTSSHLNWPSSKFKGGNYVGIDLIPFQEDVPDCGKPIQTQ